MSTSVQEVLAKVRKLRALSQSSNLHEAEAAAAKADELLQRYRLSEADFVQETESVGEHHEPLSVMGNRRQLWRVKLGAIIANHYGCVTYQRWLSNAAGGSWTQKVVGRPSDCELARDMFAWLNLEIARLASGERSRAAFSLGAVYGLANALRRARVQAEAAHNAASGAGAALVLLGRVEEARAALDKIHPKLSADRGPKMPADLSAFKRGVQAGESLHLEKVIAPQRARLLPGGT